jgi:NAD(P)H-quinone oxidoreductase subunit 6
MNLEQIIFYFFAAILLISALLVVIMQNLVRSVFLFFVTLFSLAALYLFALADFIALTQIVVYVGGVLVLMLFAFMLSNRELLDQLKPLSRSFKLSHLAALFICSCFMYALISVILNTNIHDLSWIKGSVPIQPSDNTTHQIGIQTMTRYLFPFEVLSIFLMMALIGAAHLARKGRDS